MIENETFRDKGPRGPLALLATKTEEEMNLESERWEGLGSFRWGDSNQRIKFEQKLAREEGTSEFALSSKTPLEEQTSMSIVSVYKRRREEPEDILRAYNIEDLS